MSAPHLTILAPKFLGTHFICKRLRLIFVKVKSFAPRQIQRRSFAALAITLSRKIF